MWLYLHGSILSNLYTQPDIYKSIDQKETLKCLHTERHIFCFVIRRLRSYIEAAVYVLRRAATARCLASIVRRVWWYKYWALMFGAVADGPSICVLLEFNAKALQRCMSASHPLLHAEYRYTTASTHRGSHLDAYWHTYIFIHISMYI